MRKLSAKWVPKCLNADQKNEGCHSSDQYLEFFGAIQMISFRDWWPWTKPGYTTMTRRKSNNQWGSGIAAHPVPKFPSAKICWKIYRLYFFGIKTASSSLIIFQRAKLSTRSIIHLCWCNWRTFWRKNAAGNLQKGAFSCTTIPRLTGHLQPRRNWPIWASSVLITHPILQIWPRRTTTCSMDWKNNWKFVILRPTRRSFLPRRPGWTDNFLNFFLSGLQKLEQRAKKCIELRGEYIEQIPSLIAVACFLPGRAKDLSAPLVYVFPVGLQEIHGPDVGSKIDPKESGSDSMNWIQVVQNRNNWTFHTSFNSLKNMIFFYI